MFSWVPLNFFVPGTGWLVCDKIRVFQTANWELQNTFFLNSFRKTIEIENYMHEWRQVLSLLSFYCACIFKCHLNLIVTLASWSIGILMFWIFPYLNQKQWFYKTVDWREIAMGGDWTEQSSKCWSLHNFIQSMKGSWKVWSLKTADTSSSRFDQRIRGSKQIQSFDFASKKIEN